MHPSIWLSLSVSKNKLTLAINMFPAFHKYNWHPVVSCFLFGFFFYLLQIIPESHYSLVLDSNPLIPIFFQKICMVLFSPFQVIPKFLVCSFHLFHLAIMRGY